MMHTDLESHTTKSDTTYAYAVFHQFKYLRTQSTPFKGCARSKTPPNDSVQGLAIAATVLSGVDIANS